MKKLAFAIGVAGLMGTPAFAADMPVKAPPSAPAPVYAWTGWYAGVNAGASFGNVKNDINAPATGTVVVGGFGTGTLATGFAGSDRTHPDGFIGGGQIGYNYQLSPLWVVGLEADIQGAGEKKSGTPLNNSFDTEVRLIPSTSFGELAGSSVLNYQTKIDWFGTVRARLGYVWGNGQVMSYVTGGLAYGRVDVQGTATFNLAFGTVPLSQTFGHSQVNTGWVVGYGTEGTLAAMPGWTWKIEGLYMDLGALDATGSGGSSSFTLATITTTLTTEAVTTHSHFTDGILRGGLNYKFN
jgi:outer membrane immunogenic protein